MLWYHMIHNVIIVFMVSHIAKQLSHAAVSPWGDDVITATERSIPTAVLLYYHHIPDLHLVWACSLVLLPKIKEKT